MKKVEHAVGEDNAPGERAAPLPGLGPRHHLVRRSPDAQNALSTCAANSMSLTNPGNSTVSM
jgi:hypothetical protein